MRRTAEAVKLVTKLFAKSGITSVHDACALDIEATLAVLTPSGRLELIRLLKNVAMFAAAKLSH
jgi:hypothetical protein